MLCWLIFGWMEQSLGVSTTYVRLAGLIEAAFWPDHVASNEYFHQTIISEPAVDWQMMLVLGLFLGAMLASRLSGSRSEAHMPDLWARSIGNSRIVRYLGAFLGGVVLRFGAVGKTC